MNRIPLVEGRRAFGHDPAAYDAARPDYPEPLYARLVERGCLRRGVAVFEVGAGTGLATRRLLALGAARLHAIEPDPRLADYLLGALGDPALSVDQASFEEADLPPGAFDLGVAATSFHWLEQGAALAKARAALKPGGWWAMWWNSFGGDRETDAFQAATDHLFTETPDSPSHGEGGGPPFALDQERRLDDLGAAGFEAANVDLWRWSSEYDTARLVALYATFSPIQALAAPRRRAFLEALAAIADREFGGRVERPSTTILYTARTPRSVDADPGGRVTGPRS